MRQETMLTMSHMGCNSCVKNIARALQTLPDIEVITTDLPTKLVHLRYDPEQVTMDTIKTTLSDAKYPVASERPLNAIHKEMSNAQ